MAAAAAAASAAAAALLSSLRFVSASALLSCATLAASSWSWESFRNSLKELLNVSMRDIVAGKGDKRRSTQLRGDAPGF